MQFQRPKWHPNHAASNRIGKEAREIDLSLFDHFPEPVFFTAQGTLRYSNQAALALEPSWTAGTPTPAALDLEPDEEGIFSCTLGGQDFQAAVTYTDDGLLLFLRRPARAVSGPTLAGLSIQLREQLNNFRTAVDPLTSVVEQSGEKNARLYLSVLNQCFHRLLRLTRHLELAERVGQPLQMEQAVDLAELCRQTAYGAARLAEHQNIKFDVSLPSGIVSTAGDKELLEIMLLELISNALKSVKNGGAVGLRLSSNGKRVMITVSDNGPGISQADLTAMMDGPSPESLPKPGTGLRLGLSIARSVAAAHGGAILLESRKDQGLWATASLPLRKPAKGLLRTPRSPLGSEGGFSPLLTFLSDALPWQAFEE